MRFEPATTSDAQPAELPPPAAPPPTALELAADPQHWLGILLTAHGVCRHRQRAAICKLIDRASDEPSPRLATVIIDLYLRTQVKAAP